MKDFSVIPRVLWICLVPICNVTVPSCDAGFRRAIWHWETQPRVESILPGKFLHSTTSVCDCGDTWLPPGAVVVSPAVGGELNTRGASTVPLYYLLDLHETVACVQPYKHPDEKRCSRRCLLCHRLNFLGLPLCAQKEVFSLLLMGEENMTDR